MASVRRVALVQGILAHYRAPLFGLLDRSERLAFTFFADAADAHGIAVLPPGAVSRQRFAPVRAVGPLVWQRGIVRLGLSREFDALVLMGDPHYLSTWLAAALARLRGAPVLFWTHGWRRRDRGLARLVRLMFYRLADRLLLYSERGRDLGLAAGYPGERMTVIYNALDLEQANAVVAGIERGEGAAPRGGCSPIPRGRWSSAPPG